MFFPPNTLSEYQQRNTYSDEVARVTLFRLDSILGKCFFLNALSIKYFIWISTSKFYPPTLFRLDAILAKYFIWISTSKYYPPKIGWHCSDWIQYYQNTLSEYQQQNFINSGEVARMFVALHLLFFVVVIFVSEAKKEKPHGRTVGSLEDAKISSLFYYIGRYSHFLLHMWYCCNFYDCCWELTHLPIIVECMVLKRNIKHRLDKGYLLETNDKRIWQKWPKLLGSNFGLIYAYLLIGSPKLLVF